MVIEGPAGIGKTSLLAIVRERAARSGMTVLHARGTPLEREYAMGVVRQCLEPVVRGDPDRDGLLAGAARLAEPSCSTCPTVSTLRHSACCTGSTG